MIDAGAGLASVAAAGGATGSGVRPVPPVSLAANSPSRAAVGFGGGGDFAGCDARACCAWLGVSAWRSSTGCGGVAGASRRRLMRTSCSGGGSIGGAATQCTNSSRGSRCRTAVIAIACQCWPRSLIVQHPQQIGIRRIHGFTRRSQCDHQRRRSR